MSEQVNDIQQPAAPAPISFEELKSKLILNFELMYAQFCSQLSTIPCSQDNNYPAMRHFDDGFYNFREGIRRLRLEELAPKATAPTDDPELPPAA